MNLALHYSLESDWFYTTTAAIEWQTTIHRFKLRKANKTGLCFFPRKVGNESIFTFCVQFLHGVDTFAGQDPLLKVQVQVQVNVGGLHQVGSGVRARVPGT